MDTVKICPICGTAMEWHMSWNNGWTTQYYICPICGNDTRYEHRKIAYTNRTESI